MECRQKVWYPTKQLAAEALAAILAKRDDPRLRPYKCRDCGQWHLGHRSRKLAALIKAGAAAPVKAEQPKPAPPPTVGELKRRLARIEKQWTRHQRYRLDLLAKVVDADRQMLEIEQEAAIQRRRITDTFLGPQND